MADFSKNPKKPFEVKIPNSIRKKFFMSGHHDDILVKKLRKITEKQHAYVVQ